MPRERIEYLLDDKDSALEVGQIAGYDLNNNETPSGSIITVIGKVSGRVGCPSDADEGRRHATIFF